MLVVSPNNPTGSFLHADDLAEMATLCAARDLVLIGDEVFADFPLDDAQPFGVGTGAPRSSRAASAGSPNPWACRSSSSGGLRSEGPRVSTMMALTRSLLTRTSRCRRRFSWRLPSLAPRAARRPAADPGAHRRNLAALRQAGGQARRR